MWLSPSGCVILSSMLLVVGISHLFFPPTHHYLSWTWELTCWESQEWGCWLREWNTQSARHRNWCKWWVSILSSVFAISARIIKSCAWPSYSVFTKKTTMSSSFTWFLYIYVSFSIIAAKNVVWTNNSYSNSPLVPVWCFQTSLQKKI